MSKGKRKEETDIDFYSIYAIQHNQTKRIYVGQTTQDIQKRYLMHIYELRNQRHQSKEMQEDFNTYGEDFSLFLLETVSCERTTDAVIPGNYTTGTICECKWMDRYNTINPIYGYNSQDASAIKIIKKMKVAKTTVIPFVEGVPEVNENAAQVSEQVEKTLASTIYENIKKLADAQRLSITQVEANAGVGNGTIGKWKLGHCNASVKTLTEIANTLGCTVADLVKDN